MSLLSNEDNLRERKVGSPLYQHQEETLPRWQNQVSEGEKLEYQEELRDRALMQWVLLQPHHLLLKKQRALAQEHIIHIKLSWRDPVYYILINNTIPFSWVRGRVVLSSCSLSVLAGNVLEAGGATFLFGAAGRPSGPNTASGNDCL